MQTNVKTTQSRRRGSALIMAIVITMLLFIIGIVFVLTSQKGRAIVTGSEFRQSLDAGTDAVIERINTVLIEDLFGSDNNLLNKDASDEYWDYPGSDDPWLASLEPEILSDGTNSYYGWRHISDIYGDNFNISVMNPSMNRFYDPTDSTNTAQWDGNASSRYYLSYDQNSTTIPTITSLIARIISDEDSTYLIGEDGDWDDPDDYCRWGGRADADGDGVADSRWARVPGITGPQGQNVYTAVRIVDNGGMININTAYRDPRSLNGTPDWDGTRLSHIHLQGIISTTDDNNGLDVTDMQQMRFGGLVDGTVSKIPGSPPYLDYDNNYANDTSYEADVANRFLNPALVNVGSNDYFYTPFDIMDELELRNRFLVESNVNTRCGQAWPVTFFPGAGAVGLENPYVRLPEDTVAQLQNKVANWFDKLKPGFDTGGTAIGDYNRRPLVTTYNFDRNITPKVDTAGMPASLLAAWNTWTNWNNTTPPLNWTYRPVCIEDAANGSTVGGVAVTAEVLAAAIWLGLPADIEDHENFMPLGWGGETRERIACQMAVNLIDYVDIDNVPTELTTNGGADYYYGYEAGAPEVYISRLGISKFNDGTDVTDHYAVALYNAGKDAVILTGWQINIEGAIYDLTAGNLGAEDTILIIDEIDDAEGFQAVDGFPTITAFEFDDGDRIVLLDAEGRPVDAVEVAGIATYISDPVAPNLNIREVWNTPERADIMHVGYSPDEIYIFDEVLPPAALTWEGPDNGGLGDLEGDLSLSSARITAPIQTGTPILPFLTLGEIANVLTVGATNIGGEYKTMGECWDEFLVADGGNITALERGRIDVAAFAKIDDPSATDAFSNIFRYLTVWNPFSDTIDNDGANGADDAAELAIAGRININTAPWYVIAQLPWITNQDAGTVLNANSYKLARAIVAYRDKTELDSGAVDYSKVDPSWLPPDNTKTRKYGMGLAQTDDDVREEYGFASIAELINVTNDLSGMAGTYDHWYDFRRFGRDTTTPISPTSTPPDSTADSVNDDLEERDILFQRVSNLVTVRSDVFTAYIAIRVGEEGPMRRVIAIFDRSKVFSPADKPRLVALHPVPDPS